jgi:hypothetical protein
MAETSESSGLSSLVALRKHEAERSQKQVEDARAQAEAEQRARAAAERARAVEDRARREQARLKSEEDLAVAARVELEQARALDERAEREARARRDSELRLIEERSAHHAEQLTLLARAARQRLLFTLSSALCLVTWLASAGLYVAVLRPNAEHAQSTFAQSLADEHRARLDAETNSVHAAERGAVLVERLASLEQTLRDERAVRPTTPPTHGATEKPERHGSGAAAPHGPCPDADDGDPLNPCLKR